MNKRVGIGFNCGGLTNAKVKHANGDTDIFCIEKYSTGDYEGGIILIGLEEAEKLSHDLLEMISQIRNG